MTDFGLVEGTSAFFTFTVDFVAKGFELTRMAGCKCFLSLVNKRFQLWCYPCQTHSGRIAIVSLEHIFTAFKGNKISIPVCIIVSKVESFS